MPGKVYIQRTLLLEGQPISETDLLGIDASLIVLAEPGAGKSALLDSAARHCGDRRYRAALFPLKRNIQSNGTIIVDSLDEVSRGGSSATHNIILEAANTGARRAIFASRSGEWEPRNSRFVRECFGGEVKVVRLRPFEENEQRIIFEQHAPGEDFTAFYREVQRFELAPLLGNPEFIKLFADAYIGSGRHFETKRQIFFDAIGRLASEVNPDIQSKERPPTERVIAVAEQVFAKLLLSGSVGVSISEGLTSQNFFPHLGGLVSSDRDVLSYVLDTRLFKPDESEGLHEPVHRIVAEFCAADYLVERIEKSTDRLSLKRCLALIAPNSVVRDELRGMFGWMAALGGPTLQSAAISLDPYAVLANGDPSQLSAASKRQLLVALGELAKVNPFFRRSDAWRTFSMAGFFTDDVVDLVRDILVQRYCETDLQRLILELVCGSSAVISLVPELRALLLEEAASFDSRQLAYEALASASCYAPDYDFKVLVAEGGETAIKISVQMVIRYGVERFGNANVLSLLSRIADNKNHRKRRRMYDVDASWLNDQMFASFSADQVVWFLDRLTSRLSCECGDRARYDCRCRIGVSKVCGKLLDRYFRTSAAPHNPQKLWRWMSSLFFDRSRAAGDSAAVAYLERDDALRRELQLIAIGSLRDEGEIFDIRRTLLDGCGHAGLRMIGGDFRHMADHALATGNVALWSNFFLYPSRQKEASWRIELRASMRTQARQYREFAKAWHFHEMKWQQSRHQHSWARPRAERRRKQKENAARTRQREWVDGNAEDIVSGKNEWHLFRLADYFLRRPAEIDEITSDPSLSERALSAFLVRHRTPIKLNEVPFADVRKQRLVRICTAAALAHFRKTGDVNGHDAELLRVVKTDLENYAYVEGEQDAFESAINRRALSTFNDVETFLRDYIEPQLSGSDISHTNVGWLQYKAEFRSARSTLPLEWLARFPAMPYAARQSLFQIAAQEADRSQLEGLIATRSAPHLTGEVSADEQTSRDAQFWLIRHLFFLQTDIPSVLAALGDGSEGLLAIEAKAGRLNRDESVEWPRLGARKSELILAKYVEHWPKVDLPNSYGSSDPKPEKAYRFLSDLIWGIPNDEPARALDVLDRLLADRRFADFTQTLQHLRAITFRRLSLEAFVPPTAKAVTDLLDRSKIASVGDLRGLMLDLLQGVQAWVRGSPTNPQRTFYDQGRHVEENHATERIVDQLSSELNRRGISVTMEHRMVRENRCDITASCVIAGEPRLLVIEVKGQWNRELYTAASTQLAERYAIHPNAANEGIYLVLWYGPNVEVNGRSHKFTSPDELLQSIRTEMPERLAPLIDVFVLDVAQ